MKKAIIQPVEDEQESIDGILQSALLSVKLKKKKRKTKGEEQTVGIEEEGSNKLREVTLDEQQLLDRSEKEWIYLFIVDTPRFRMDKQRKALIEQLTDFNIQYDTIYSVLKEDKKSADELYAKYSDAKTALKLKIDKVPSSSSMRLDPMTVSSLHKLKFLHDHIESVVRNLLFFDMILMDILEQEMKINQALIALRATEVMSSVNTAMKYARGIDLTYSTQMITSETKLYIKQLRQRKSLDTLLANHEASNTVMKEQSQFAKVTTEVLLGLLADNHHPGGDKAAKQLTNLDHASVLEPRQ